MSLPAEPDRVFRSMALSWVYLTTLPVLILKARIPCWKGIKMFAKRVLRIPTTFNCQAEREFREHSEPQSLKDKRGCRWKAVDRLDSGER